MYSEGIPKESLAELQQIANEQNALVMSFIAPDKLVRKSPIEYDYASIGIADLYGIEAILEKISKDESLPKKLILVIHTPGGLLSAATKISKYLRVSFDYIEAYVPYEAASGGTMMCLIANKLVLDKAANLTPIDPQINYKGVRISTSSYSHAISDFQESYGKMRPEEIPCPFQQMADDFDPIIKTEMDKITNDAILLAWKFLISSQLLTEEDKKDDEKRDKLLDVVFSLTRARKPHSHIIDLAEAKDMGLAISEDSDKIKLMKVFKKWVSSNLDKEEVVHIIQYVCPNNTKKENGEGDENQSSSRI